jgi:teichuronic acid biosynthesis glycosyltransferase TuaC
MLRVLTLSTLYPDANRPTFGVFVARQTAGLARLADVEVEVAAPLGLPPWPLSRIPRYAEHQTLPLEEQWSGIRVHRPRFPIVPLVGSRWNARALARSILPRLKEVRQRFPFDVINAEFFWPEGPAAMHLARSLDIPFSVTARGSDIHYWMTQPAVARQLLEAGHAADGLLAVSAAIGKVMADYGFPAERIRLHYTGVDRVRFRLRDREEAKAQLGVSGPLLVTIGALIPGKGQRDAILAAERIPEATLLLAGDGPDRRMLEALIGERGLADRVRLLGNVSRDEVADLLAAADVMVLPTRSEGLANVWVEALVSGTPVVTTDVGGAAEVIDQPEAGALVPHEPEQIAAAVSAILAQPPERAKVHATADKFNSDVKVARLHAHLAGIVADYRMRGTSASRA